MLLSRLLGERYREKPAEASLDSHVFLLRGGYMRQVAAGLYSLLPPAKRVERKLEAIIREEMDAIDGQEVLFPVVLPAELWKESGRFESVGGELLRARDRNGHNVLLGMTHEEAAVHLARSEAATYAKYPFMIYQIQTKFRDEPRPRAGLIRVREFTMKDAYSFHTSREDLKAYYGKCLAAYERIFRRAGCPVVPVESDTGMMGGETAHEFMLVSPGGEDSLVLCPHCGYRANVEIAAVKASHMKRAEGVPTLAATPGVSTIETLAGLFRVGRERTVKACVFAAEGRRPLLVFIRGDYDVNEAKLRKLVRADVRPLTEHGEAGLCFGFIGPRGLETDVQVIFDASLEGENDLVAGANREGFHLTGVNITPDCLGSVYPEAFYDLAKANDRDGCPSCGKAAELKRGHEMGNIFQLGTKYTESMNMTYTDADGGKRHPVMGCYGIGVGRLIAGIIEASHDENGPVWPMPVAPWQVHICALGAGKSPEVAAEAGRLYALLSERFEVIYDDRDVSAGVAFADADLIGVPLRVIVGKRGLGNGELELTARDKSFTEMVAKDKIADAIEEKINLLMEKYK